MLTRLEGSVVSCSFVILCMLFVTFAKSPTRIVDSETGSFSKHDSSYAKYSEYKTGGAVVSAEKKNKKAVTGNFIKNNTPVTSRATVVVVPEKSDNAVTKFPITQQKTIVTGEDSTPLKKKNIAIQPGSNLNAGGPAKVTANKEVVLKKIPIDESQRTSENTAHSVSPQKRKSIDSVAPPSPRRRQLQ